MKMKTLSADVLGAEVKVKLSAPVFCRLIEPPSLSVLEIQLPPHAPIKVFETLKLLVIKPVPLTWRELVGLLVPIPTLWLVVSKVTKEVPAALAMFKALVESDLGIHLAPARETRLPVVASTLKMAEAVALLPTKRSTVAFLGYTVPLA